MNRRWFDSSMIKFYGKLTFESATYNLYIFNIYAKGMEMVWDLCFLTLSHHQPSHFLEVFKAVQIIALRGRA